MSSVPSGVSDCSSAINCFLRSYQKLPTIFLGAVPQRRGAHKVASAEAWTPAGPRPGPKREAHSGPGCGAWPWRAPPYSPPPPPGPETHCGKPLGAAVRADRNRVGSGPRPRQRPLGRRRRPSAALPCPAPTASSQAPGFRAHRAPLGDAHSNYQPKLAIVCEAWAKTVGGTKWGIIRLSWGATSTFK